MMGRFTLVVLVFDTPSLLLLHMEVENPGELRRSKIYDDLCTGIEVDPI